MVHCTSSSPTVIILTSILPNNANSRIEMKDCTLSDGGIVFALQWNFNNSILGGLSFASGWQYLQMTSCTENIPQNIDHLLQLCHPSPSTHPTSPHPSQRMGWNSFTYSIRIIPKRLTRNTSWTKIPIKYIFGSAGDLRWLAQLVGNIYGNVTKKLIRKKLRHSLICLRAVSSK